MARKRRKAWRGWWVAAAVIVAALAGAGWWWVGDWHPDRKHFPVQGAYLRASDGPVNWTSLKAGGADFVYLRASSGGSLRDPAFTRSLEGARAAGLQVGALHHFDACKGADEQSANFVTTVPRDATLLPPAVELVLDESECAAPPAEGAMQSELTAFLNQIEAHVGRAAILKLSPAFEARYHVAVAIDRNLWVTGDFLAPGYAGRPWIMWTATTRLRSPALEGRLRWVVVRP